MRKKNKKKISIFPKLVVSYLLSFIIGVVGVVGGLVFFILIKSDGSLNNISPDAVVNDEYELENLDIVYEVGGWVEKLDEEYRVQEVYGEKKTSRKAYTANELLEMTRWNDSECDYAYFYEAVPDGAYLVCYPEEKLEITLSLDMGESNALDAVVLLVPIVSGLVMSLYIYRKIRIPLKKLAAGMQRMEAGERDFSLDFRADGEFVALRDAFNTMLSKLKQEEEEKAKMQEDRHQMLLELSHDIRTPIATIGNCALALQEGVVAEDKKEDYYRTIVMKADRVNGMATDLFTMLKMESSGYTPDFENIDFNEFMRRLCAEYYEDIENAGLFVKIDIVEEPVWIDGNEELLCRSVGNLISNAVRYNKTGKIIEIRTYRDGGAVCAAVADDGAPIDEEIAASMFTAFARGDKSRNSADGTGLGLAIARTVAEKHGGSVWYQYENGRNLFLMRLPVK